MRFLASVLITLRRSIIHVAAEFGKSSEVFLDLSCGDSFRGLLLTDSWFKGLAQRFPVPALLSLTRGPGFWFLGVWCSSVLPSFCVLVIPGVHLVYWFSVWTSWSACSWFSVAAVRIVALVFSLVGAGSGS